MRKICADFGFNFTLLTSFETWTGAGLSWRGSKEYNSLQGRFDLTDVSIILV